MTHKRAIGAKLLGIVIWLGCVAGVGAQLPGGAPRGTPPRAESYVSPVSANIPAATDKPAALVNGEMVSMADVKSLLELRPYPNSLSAADVRGFRQAAVDTLVNDVLVRQFLAKFTTPVTKAEIAAEMKSLEILLRKEKKTLKDVLKENGQTLEQLQRDVSSRVQWRTYLKKRLPDDQARKYYADNKPFFDNVTVTASHVLVKVPAGISAEQKQQLLNKAQAIRNEIVAGKVSFEVAAKSWSDCPSKDKGGSIGVFPFKFRVVDEFARAAFALKIGQISEVVTTSFGYHVIKVTARSEPKQLSTYESVRDDVRAIWSHDVELYQQIIDYQRKNTKIQVFLQ